MIERASDSPIQDRRPSARARRNLVRLRTAVALYAAGALLHLLHAILFTDPRTLPTDWDTFLALEIALFAPLWPLALLARLLGLPA